jgi:hypothetical protein
MRDVSKREASLTLIQVREREREREEFHCVSTSMTPEKLHARKSSLIVFPPNFHNFLYFLLFYIVTQLFEDDSFVD